ncbi:hypothetical protein [Hymenobacter psychrotolerans]|uniref:Uncharacterized protein n=1 Tax=Hymenobacter psychrotolerans DSM 18569 TaxID=1121959 RepID=A0A1M6Z8G9_9BACT|nr:hypothetical protein [Hymenobacter psychrotolerans]SHL26693.1 hypothetical protein SAMN02746009_02454 [Hymenobacter psychrotolerans DSM 18569]
MDLFDLKGPQGKDNTPGLKQNLFIAAEQDFTSIKGVKTSTGAGDSVTVDGTHGFAASKGFVKCYSTLGTAQLKLGNVGERDGRGKKIDFTFFHPGNAKEAAEFDRQIKNHSAIMLVTTADGTVLQLGQEGLGVEILGEYDSGTLGSGRNGFTFKVEGYANGLLFYEGDIKLKDGSSIAASTGVVTPAGG